MDSLDFVSRTLARAILPAMLTMLALSAAPVQADSPRLQYQAPSSLRSRVRIPLPAPQYKICFVSPTGVARCMTREGIDSRLGALLTPDELARVNAVLDDFAAAKGVDSKADLLVTCAGGWRAIDVDVLAKRGQKGRSSGAALDDAERTAVLASCSGRVVTGLGGDADTSHQDTVNAVVAAMDAGFEDCRDSGTGPVRDDDEPRQYPFERYPGEVSEALRDFKKDAIKDTIRSGLVPYEALGSEQLGTWDGHVNADQVVLRLLMELGKYAEEAKQAREAAEAARAIAAEEALEKAAEEERRAQEEDGRASEEEEEAAQQCIEKTTCEDPAAPTAAYPSPDASGLSCAEKQAAWDAFQSYCARSDWREFRCDQFLRFINDCPDITVIQPGPEGDATCPTRHSDADNARLAADLRCRQQGMFAIPGEDGVAVCVSDLKLVKLPEVDICLDPRGRATAAQCAGASSKSPAGATVRP